MSTVRKPLNFTTTHIKLAILNLKGWIKWGYNLEIDTVTAENIEQQIDHRNCFKNQEELRKQEKKENKEED